MRTRWRCQAAVAMVLVFVLQITAQPAAVTAKQRGANGLIAFDWNQGEAVFTINPDGTGERQLLSTSTCCPRFSPDGLRLAVPRGTDDRRIGGATVNVDGTNYHPLPIDDPTLNVGSGVWSPMASGFQAKAGTPTHQELVFTS